MAARRHMDSWDWCEGLGRKAGNYAAIGYLVLLCVVDYVSSLAYGRAPAGVYVVLVLGLLVSVASRVVANATTGPVRSGVLAGLASLPLIAVSLALLVNSHSSQVLGVILFLVAIAFVCLTAATMLARWVNPESQSIRWLQFSFAIVGIMVFPLIVITTFMAIRAALYVPSIPVRSPRVAGGVLILGLVLPFLALWFLVFPILGLAHSLSRRNTTTVARLGLRLGRIAVIALVTVVLGPWLLVWIFGCMFCDGTAGFEIGFFVSGAAAAAALVVLLCPVLQFVGGLGACLVHIVGVPEAEDDRTDTAERSVRRSHAHLLTHPQPAPQEPLLHTSFAKSLARPPAPATTKPLSARPARRTRTAFRLRDPETEKKLARLWDLLTRGLITNADYERKRKELLDGK